MSDDDILKRDINICMGRIVDLGERIKDLEKKEDKNYTNINELRRQIEVNDGEIASLREKLKLERKVKVWDAKVINRINRQLNELKESNRLTHNRSCGNKEVLRELLNGFEKYYRKKISYMDLRVIIAELLAKLDAVGSAAYTEEHDCYKEWTKNIKVHNLDKLVGETEKKEFETEFTKDCKRWFKDSGGEKEISNLSDLGLNPRKSQEDRDRVVDSKPPEPNKNDVLLRHYIIDSDEPREDNYTCRLCGNGITLVEYEVSKLTIEVQREDLQRWKKEFEESGNPEWEYIEEEYSL